MKTLKLYHYSNKENLKTINPKFFGENYYTSSDLRVSSIKRSFFYTLPCAEYLLKSCRFLYTAKINEDKIYDLTKDKKQYLKNNNPEVEGFSFTKIINKAKNGGYKGIKYFVGYDVVILFNNIKVNAV